MAATVIVSNLAMAAVSAPVQATEDFAIVGDQHISMQEFEAAYRAGMRKRFYHGKVPEEQLKAFRKEVSNTLIERALLVQEARRRGVQPDEAEIARQLKQYEQRYSKQAGWDEHKDDILKGLRAALEEESLLRGLERQVRNVDSPAEAEVKRFYQKNPDLFTTPEQLRLSLILLKVAPSSPADVWKAAREEADALVQRLHKGSDFAEMARIHSGDATAAAGGDMGFLHKGMLAAPAQAVIDQLQPGELSEPVMLLTGVAIFRMEERKAAELNAYDKVAQRARLLLKRQLSENAWQGLAERLRATVKVSINEAAL